MKISSVPPSTSLFEAILVQAKRPKAIKAAENVRAACDYLDEKKIQVTLSEIERLCLSTGPKAQSIRNNQVLYNYVRARQAEQKLRATPEKTSEEFITQDVQANAVIYAMKAQLRREKEHQQNLKRAIQNAGDYDIEATLRTGRLVSFSNPSQLVDSELVEMARHLLTEDHLKRFGLSTVDDRIISTERNNRVFLEKRHVVRLRMIANSKFSN